MYPEKATVKLLNYLLTPWSRVLLEKLIKKFPAFYRTPKFITVLTSARHLSLSWANSIQSPQPLPTSWRSILILSSHLRLGLPNGSFPQVSPPKPLPSSIRATCPANLILLDFITRTVLCGLTLYERNTHFMLSRQSETIKRDLVNAT